MDVKTIAGKTVFFAVMVIFIAGFSAAFGQENSLTGVVVVVLAGLIGVFTLWPPDNILFVDLSGANTWAQIPC